MDESFKGPLRLIVSAHGFLGPANRRQDFPIQSITGAEACGYPNPNPKTPDPKPNLSLRLADSPEPTPKTISRRGILKFRPLAKLISGYLLWLGLRCLYPRSSA